MKHRTLAAGALLMTHGLAAAYVDPDWTPTWDDVAVLAHYRDRPMRLEIVGSGQVILDKQPVWKEVQSKCTDEKHCNVSASKYTTFVFTAVPNTGAVWKGWSGGCISAGMALTCRITNSDPHNVLAVFSNP